MPKARPRFEQYAATRFGLLVNIAHPRRFNDGPLQTFNLPSKSARPALKIAADVIAAE
jgi:hypothetical protein